MQSKTLRNVLKYRDDPIGFIQKYIKVLHVQYGEIPLILNEVQRSIITEIHNAEPNESIERIEDRQSGKTTLMAAYMVYLATYGTHLNIGILSSKKVFGEALLCTFKYMYERLPKKIQLVRVVWKRDELRFDNGTHIRVGSSGSYFHVGHSFDLLYCEEFKCIKDFASLEPSLALTTRRLKGTLVKISTDAYGT